MSWFKRLKDGIQTATKYKKETPDGVWHKCDNCGELTIFKDLVENCYICPSCDYHTRISSEEYFDIIFENKYTRLFDDVISTDALKFVDLKSYESRLVDARKKTQLKDSMAVATGKIKGKGLTVCAMDFMFIGGSMGSVVGEKISRAIDYCIENKTPLMIISKSGGARMMESAFSLMQMAKSSAKLTRLAKARLPYFSLMTDPTTGGVTASYAMLGDINMAEPKALIGFAGPRVIKETIKRDLPEGFQTSEFLLEKGFLDFIVHRKELRSKLEDLLTIFSNIEGDKEVIISEDVI
jgi:acetyl-CoA carboxylase carboxyl transferase subunit beta